MGTKGKSGTMVVKPGQKAPRDNSSGGSVVTTGSGHVVGAGHVSGSSGIARDQESAREAVRRRWAEANSSSVTSGVKLVSSSSDKVVSRDDEKNNVQCPVCNRGFPEANINNHLDTCLGAQDSADAHDDMDDGDDDLLLAASIELENSLINDRAIEISDDDDDEPLVKRRSLTKRKTHTNKNDDSDSDDDDKFDNQTQQDDQDILAALEDSNDGNDADQSMFACPICDNLLSHGEMFSHLDQCTKNI